MVTETLYRFGWGAWIILAAIALGSSAEQATTERSVLDRPVAEFVSHSESAFEALLRFGRENQAPLGLIVSNQLCSTSLRDFKVARVPIRVALARLGEKIPSYEWKLDDGVVVFAPKDTPRATKDFLRLKVSPYTIPQNTLRAQGVFAWIDIKASLRPKEGTAFDILSSPNAKEWPPLSFKDVSVQQVLNLLVVRNAGGAWLLVPFHDLSKVADQPFSLEDYSEPHALRHSPCDSADRP